MADKSGNGGDTMSVGALIFLIGVLMAIVFAVAYAQELKPTTVEGDLTGVRKGEKSGAAGFLWARNVSLLIALVGGVIWIIEWAIYFAKNKKGGRRK